MTEVAKGQYIVFEDWVELRRFSRPDGALLFQKFMKDFHPSSTVRVWHEQGKTLRLIEHEEPDSVSDTAGQEMLKRLKGGGKRMVNGKENKPVKKFQAGGVSAALWENITALRDGRQIESLSVTLDRRYKDGEGEWKSSSSFKESDIPKALLVLAKAYDFMTAKGEATAEEAAD